VQPLLFNGLFFSPGFFLGLSLLILELPIGLSLPLQEKNLSGVDESVNDCVCDGVISEDLIKLPERQVRGGDCA